MNQAKHNKLRNTGLLFEFLIRQITIDVVNKSKDSKATKLVKKFFNQNTQLGKEFALYNAILNKKFVDDKKASYFVDQVITNRANLNLTELRREKYNLIKEIKETYNLVDFLSTRIDNYKIYASVYNLFEHNLSLSPDKKTIIYFNLLEYITTKPVIDNDTEIIKEDKDIQIITYRILLEKFNKKYDSFDHNQKKLLKAYVNNLSNVHSLKEYVTKIKPQLKKELTSRIKNITNKVTKIKLTEAIHSFDKICNVESKSKIVNDNIVLQLLRYLELNKQLKNYGSKSI